ncbi:MAG: hypothetical protein H7840_00055 [Alphaproteobacteria bacterium]
MPLSVVRVQAGGHRFAVEARWIRAMRDQPPSSAASPAGAEAVTLESLLGSLVPDASRRRWLVVKTGLAERVISVAEPVVLDTIAADRVFPLPPLVAARLAFNGVRALALDPSGVLFLVDLQELMGVRPASTGGG